MRHKVHKKEVPVSMCCAGWGHLAGYNTCFTGLQISVHAFVISYSKSEAMTLGKRRNRFCRSRRRHDTDEQINCDNNKLEADCNMHILVYNCPRVASAARLSQDQGRRVESRERQTSQPQRQTPTPKTGDSMMRVAERTNETHDSEKFL